MLCSLSIQNYALISGVKIDFNKGFSIITGETGAGKSILLGALSLILGQRADVSVLKNKEDKCIIEAEFGIKEYGLQTFFDMHDLDYGDVSLIRREIAPSGKSRAFINDTPVNLGLLKDFGSQLVDVHSQHQNLLIGDNSYQLMVVDSYAENMASIQKYKKSFALYKKKQAELKQLKEDAAKQKTDEDYWTFQLEQLLEAKLNAEEQQELEKELGVLEHSEDIQTNLSKISFTLAEGEIPLLPQIKECIKAAETIANFYPKAKGYAERIQTCFYELDDIASEADMEAQNVGFDPERADFLRQRLDTIYSLQQKHGVQDIAGLLEVQQSFQEKIDSISSVQDAMDALEKEIEGIAQELEKQSQTLSKRRSKAAPKICKSITGMLQVLGMPNARFHIDVNPLNNFSEYGKDEVMFMFSANKSMDMQEISKVASGGELSRVMLSIKALIAKSTTLPTIIFDEIDTGVSGDIADKMGNIMKEMSGNIQIIDITHLPQIASKGDFHYLVYKEDSRKGTNTFIKLLTHDERVTEIAKMLSGKELTQAAYSNAIELLKN